MKIQAAILSVVFIGIFSSTAYAGNDKGHGKQLPPGLQKKAMAGQPLPPGWQKKLVRGEIMDRDVYLHTQIVVPVDKLGFITVRIEGKLIKLVEATRKIVEILD